MYLNPRRKNQALFSFAIRINWAFLQKLSIALTSSQKIRGYLLSPKASRCFLFSPVYLCPQWEHITVKAKVREIRLISKMGIITPAFSPSWWVTVARASNPLLYTSVSQCLFSPYPHCQSGRVVTPLRTEGTLPLPSLRRDSNIAPSLSGEVCPPSGADLPTHFHVPYLPSWPPRNSPMARTCYDLPLGEGWGASAVFPSVGTPSPHRLPPVPVNSIEGMVVPALPHLPISISQPAVYNKFHFFCQFFLLCFSDAIF